MMVGAWRMNEIARGGCRKTISEAKNWQEVPVCMLCSVRRTFLF